MESEHALYKIPGNSKGKLEKHNSKMLFNMQIPEFPRRPVESLTREGEAYKSEYC